jgi:23S rRNA (cytidine1920-2'-O)/16S rRNA (cytidine1409-2'-O)-methyltransferase
VHEGVNARYLRPGDVGDPLDMAVIDVSFISLDLILPAVLPLVPAGPVLPLVKPQFEVGRREVGRGGIVRDPSLWSQAILSVARSASALGREVGGVIASPIAGARGNREYFLHLVPGPGLADQDLRQRVREVTGERMP